MGRLGSRVPALGIKTLSDLQIDVDKDWRAHGIYNLGDLTPKVDGAYNIGSSAAEFDTVYAKAGPPPGADSIGREELKEPAVDTAYLYDDAATSAKVGPSVDLEFVRSNDNTVAGDISAAADGAYNLGSSANKFNTVYATSVPGMADLIYKTTSEIANIAYVAPTVSTPAGILDGWGSRFSKDIIYHGNFNLPSDRARDIIAEATHGMAGDLVGVKGISKQVTEKKDFAFRTETPNHAYWHRMYNTPAAFETVYQDYTTSMQKKGTTPSKSAPNTLDPNPQPGACWSVSMLSDGTQIGGGFAGPGPDPLGMTWDATYLWNTDFTANYVYQLTKDGTPTGNGFASPAPNPWGIAWDGNFLWCCTFTAGYIYQLERDGTQTGNGFSIPYTPAGLTWDGTYLWNGGGGAGYTYKLKTDGTQTGGGFATPGSSSSGIRWDGAYLWNADLNAGYIYQMNTDGTRADGGFASPGTNPRGLTWDGTYFWHADDNASFFYQLGNAGNFDVNYRIFTK